jgi:hypothetical protein
MLGAFNPSQRKDFRSTTAHLAVNRISGVRRFEEGFHLIPPRDGMLGTMIDIWLPLIQRRAVRLLESASLKILKQPNSPPLDQWEPNVDHCAQHAVTGRDEMKAFLKATYPTIRLTAT